jgi:hypothetical protein
MKANYNVTETERKALVTAIENLTGDKASTSSCDLRLRDRDITSTRKAASPATMQPSWSA